MGKPTSIDATHLCVRCTQTPVTIPGDQCHPCSVITNRSVALETQSYTDWPNGHPLARRAA